MNMSDNLLLLLLILLGLQTIPAAFIGSSHYLSHHPPTVAQMHNGKIFRRSRQLSMIGTGFSFNDGKQILVSVQKPLGIVLEQDPIIRSEMTSPGPIRVVEMDPNGSAARGGVKEGDVLLAVQNMSVEFKDLEEVLSFIGDAPRVVNLRLLRG